MESNAGYDALDLQLLHALEVDARAPFSRIATVLGVSDQTVARRFRRLQTEADLRVVGVRCAAAEDSLDHWLLRVRCAPEGAMAIAEALARRPDTSWIGLTSGGTEVTCTANARTRGHADDLLIGKLPRTPHIVDIRAHQLLHRFYGGPSGWLSKSGALSPGQAAALAPAPARENPGPAVITAEDEPLVAALEQDGRATYPELQKATGRSESAVKRRLAQLVATGALYVDVEFDSDQLGYRNVSMLCITTAPRALHTVGEELATHPEVAYAAATTGPSNLMTVVVTRDTSHLYRYLSDRLGRLDGVEHVETMPFLRRVKQLTYRPFRG
ncbi:Lrp/AsnC family transcriptional regulator [Streptomyces sp. RKAG290]|uniref:Lrp/AsnC family transcriptional regulator n=1 Tax=Streptomyces sp. RKAG290 TaxID=2888348 RepID=UPI0020343951|nr:AsnC family transcriptional regulator [Streptomyces sp. RKAG290]MCM2412303.1 AsnC family transcriptional regulator [Streptomyces sp. RKAG290]